MSRGSDGLPTTGACTAGAALWAMWSRARTRQVMPSAVREWRSAAMMRSIATGVEARSCCEAGLPTSELTRHLAAASATGPASRSRVAA